MKKGNIILLNGVSSAGKTTFGVQNACSVWQVIGGALRVKIY